MIMGEYYCSTRFLVGEFFIGGKRFIIQQHCGEDVVLAAKCRARRFASCSIVRVESSIDYDIEILLTVIS
jgi:hypothetical protein